MFLEKWDITVFTLFLTNAAIPAMKKNDKSARQRDETDKLKRENQPTPVPNVNKGYET